MAVTSHTTESSLQSVCFDEVEHWLSSLVKTKKISLLLVKLVSSANSKAPLWQWIYLGVVNRLQRELRRKGFIRESALCQFLYLSKMTSMKYCDFVRPNWDLQDTALLSNILPIRFKSIFYMFIQHGENTQGMCYKYQFWSLEVYCKKKNKQTKYNLI